jgi:hypothetical protein
MVIEPSELTCGLLNINNTASPAKKEVSTNLKIK